MLVLLLGGPKIFFVSKAKVRFLPRFYILLVYIGSYACALPVPARKKIEAILFLFTQEQNEVIFVVRKLEKEEKQTTGNFSTNLNNNLLATR